jgi:DNA-binding CsgD family transcriptional regulator/class 3 adenylate cyclase
LDVAAQLGRIAAPTLYLHAAGDRIVPLEHGRFLAAHTPGARLVALPGEDHLPFLSGSDHALAEIERMVTGSIRHAQADSGLSAVLATEICNAAEFALRAGDRAWSELRWQQSTLVESAVKRHSGQEVASPLDGSVALFRRPSDAAACARAIIDGTAALGLHARAGVHMGEIVRAGGMTAGVALHLATWVMQLARAGEVLASGPAFDLMPGTSGRFELAGTQVFPGLPGEWRIYRQVRDGTDGSGTEVTGGAGTSQPLAVLSRREREIAALLALGLANRQIADELTISLGTVERHVANILVKLGYRSRSQVAAWAAEHGLSRPSETAEAAP